MERIKKYYSVGPYAGLVFMFFLIIDVIVFSICCIIWPAHTIEEALDFPYREYRENKEKFGDHKFTVLPKKV